MFNVLYPLSYLPVMMERIGLEPTTTRVVSEVTLFSLPEIFIFGRTASFPAPVEQTYDICRKWRKVAVLPGTRLPEPTV